MGTFPIRRSAEQIDWVTEQWQIEADELFIPGHLLIFGLGYWIPAFISINVTCVGMMGSVTDTPTVVGHQDGDMAKVSNEAIQPFELREGAMSTVVSNHK